MVVVAFAGQERMPVRERAVLIKPAVGTGFGHPGNAADIVFGQFDAGRNQCTAIGVFGAFAALLVKITAGNRCIVNFFGIFILEFYQAAFAAVHADGFPLVFREVFKLFVFPKTFLHFLPLF